MYSPRLDIERNEQKSRLALRNGVTGVRVSAAINQDKLMINKLVGAAAPLLVLLSIVYLRTNYRPSQTPRANCRTVVLVSVCCTHARGWKDIRGVTRN